MPASQILELVWPCTQGGSSSVRDVLVLTDRCDFILIETVKAEVDDVGRFGYHEFARAGDAAGRSKFRIFRQQIIRRSRGCARRRALRRPGHARRCARAGRDDREWIPETIGASYPLGRGTLFAGLPGSDPFADARVRDALAAIER